MTDPHPEIIHADGEPVTLPTSGTSLGDLVEQPAKVMRIGGMIRQLLEEVKAAPLDEASRSRLRTIHLQSIQELKDGLAPELVDELERLSLPFDSDAPSEGELRIAQAQLVGWLEACSTASRPRSTPSRSRRRRSSRTCGSRCPAPATRRPTARSHPARAPTRAACTSDAAVRTGSHPRGDKRPQRCPLGVFRRIPAPNVTHTTMISSEVN